MNNTKRVKIFEKLKKHIGNPTTELNYNSTFELLIAVILSAQATDIGVNKATKQLFVDAPTPQKMFNLGVDNLKKYIKTIGLFNTKAKNIIKTCQILIERHQSKVPDNRADLEQLAGVGRKTANVVLNTAFGKPVIAVDTHIFRVSNRTKIATGNNVLVVELKLTKTVPNEYKKDAHHLLILHGRYTCVARKPKCGSCVIMDLCEFKDKEIK